MPFAINQGIRIHYEVEGQGSPLVMVHPFACTLETWRELGYTQELGKEHRLILIDLRGHGRSDKPHDPVSYLWEPMVRDVGAVLDDLGVAKAHYLGYSLGARLGMELNRFGLLSRFQSLVLGGGTPYPGQTEADRQFRAHLLARTLQGPRGLVSWFEEQVGPLPPAEKSRLLAADAEALAASRQAPPPPAAVTAALDDYLRTIDLPCLIWAGTADPMYEGVEAAAKHIRHASFFSLPGLNHMQAYYRSDLVLPHVQAFLALPRSH